MKSLYKVTWNRLERLFHLFVPNLLFCIFLLCAKYPDPWSILYPDTIGKCENEAVASTTVYLAIFFDVKLHTHL